jgi:pseudaminic acid biosynthesis-associated methylase
MRRDSDYSNNGADNMNETEEFWSGPFGDAYTDRNKINMAATVAFFARALDKADGVESVLELGANAGHNLLAIKRSWPNARTMGVEINSSAFARLKNNCDYAIQASLLDGPFYQQDETLSDLVFTKGVLIHIDPDDLPVAYGVIYNNARRYILLSEYFAREPTPVTYRGHEGKLWRRDFAGEMLDAYNGELTLLDYGFISRLDPFPQDDVTWYLLEKAHVG